MTDESFGYYIVGIAGQSNAHGWGEGYDPKIDFTDPRVVQLANSGSFNDKVILASDPLEQKGGARSGDIGWAMAFARMYVHTIPASKKLLLLPCAVGGTGFSDNRWNPGNDLAENYKQHILKALALPGSHRFIGTLWHQGENDTDSSLEAANYFTALTALIDYIRKIPGLEKSLWVVGEMVNSWVAGETSRESVQKTLQNLPGRVPLTGCASAVGLSPQGDGIHFSAESCRVLGERYLKALNNAASNNIRTESASLKVSNPSRFVNQSYIPLPAVTPNPPTPPSPPPSDSLPPAEFRFSFASGSVVDLGKNNLSLAITAPSIIATVPGRGKALAPKPGGMIEVAVGLGVSYTKAAWVYALSVGVNPNIISGTSSADHVLWSLGGSGTVSAGQDGGYTLLSDPNPFLLNTWVHFAVTYNNPTQTLKLFRNGQKVAQTSTGVNFPGSSAPTRIGYFSPSDIWDGYIDLPAVWNSALSEGQVLSLYQSGVL